MPRILLGNGLNFAPVVLIASFYFASSKCITVLQYQIKRMAILQGHAYYVKWVIPSESCKARGWVSCHFVAVWLETSWFLRNDEVAMDMDQVWSSWLALIYIYICFKKIRAFRIYPWYIYIHTSKRYIYNYIHDILIYDILIYDILCKYVCSNPQKDGKVVCYCFGEILSFCLSGGYEMLQIQSLIAESSINEMVNFP